MVHDSAESLPVLLFQRIVPSYRVPVFRRLNSDLGIIVCHTDESINGGDSFHRDMDYDHILLPGGFVLGRTNLFSQNVLPILRRLRPKVVICEYAFGNLTFWKLLFLRSFLRFKLIGWSHGIKNRDMAGSAHSFHYRANIFVTARLDAIILYSTHRRAIMIDRIKGMRDKVFVANNTLATDKYFSVYDRYAQIARTQLRQELELEDVFTIGYMGRLLSSKRLDLLLGAWTEIRKSYPVNLVIIGSGEQESLFTPYLAKDGFYYLGAIHNIEDSGKYLAASDVMMIPGAVGLALIHAFSFRLPLITCRSGENGPFHGPEFEYLTDGENGFVCDSSSASLAAHVEKLILDPALLARMKENALRTVEEEANIDRMIDGFRQAIDFVLTDDR